MTPSPRDVSHCPIGVFDSGLGGLSVLRAVRALLPGHPLVYVADSGHAPYGDKPAATIAQRAEQLTRFLLAQRVGAILVACNTASVVAAQGLRHWCPVPLVAMEPAIKPAVAATRSGVIGVLATARTLESENVARLLREHGHGARVLLQPCPGLVEQVERGDLESPATLELLKTFVRPLLEAGADTLVLGCTHYPFLAPQIRALFGPQVTLVDPAPAVAQQLRRRLQAIDAAAPALSVPAGHRRTGDERFYTSGPILASRAMFQRLWHAHADVHPLPEGAP